MKKTVKIGFYHDFNDRNDVNIMRLRINLGWEGYGLYWALIEKLRVSENNMVVNDANVIAYEFQADVSKIESLICSFNLFVFTEDLKYFYSEILIKRIESEKEQDYLSKKSIAGKISADKRETKRLTEGQHNSTEGQHNSTEGQHNSTEGQHNSAEGQHNSTEGQHNSTEGQHNSTEGQHNSAEGQHNSTEGQHNSGKRKMKEPLDLIMPFDSESFKIVWEHLLSTKKWKNKSHQSLQMALKKLSANSEIDAIKMIENAIAGEWQGIFDLTPNEKNYKYNDAEKPSMLSNINKAYLEGRNNIIAKYGGE